MTQALPRRTSGDGELYEQVHSRLSISEGGLDIAAMYNDDFDAHSFVQQFLGPTSSDKEESDADGFKSKSTDLRVGLSRLNVSITEVDRKIHELMGRHSDEFIERVGQIKQVRDTMATIHAHIQDIEKSGTRYVVLAHTSAKQSVGQHLEDLHRLHANSARLNDLVNLVARTRKILAVYTKLVTTMDQISSFNMMDSIKDAPSLHQHAERVLAASILIEELQSISTYPKNGRPKTRRLIDDARSIDIITVCLSDLPHMQESLLEQVENVLMCGLRSLSPPLLGTALQAALHLKLLGPVVRNFLDDLNDVLLERLRTVLDLLAVGKELGETQPPILSSSLKSHLAEQHALSPPLLRWIDIIWERIQTFIVVELGSIVNKVQMLERILQRKYAPQSTQTLLDIVVSNLGDSPTTLLWSAFARSLEQLVHECIQESDFWWYIFVFSYPKLADQFNMLASHLIILSDDFETSKLTGHMEKMLTSRESDYQSMLAQKWRSLAQDIQKAALEESDRGPQAMINFMTQFKRELDICMDQAPLQLRVFFVAAEYLDSLLNTLRSSIKKADDNWSFTNKQLTTQHLQNIRIARIFEALHGTLSDWTVVYQEGIEKKLKQWHLNVVKVIWSDLLSPLVDKTKEDTAMSLSRIHQSKRTLETEAFASPAAETEVSPYMMDFVSRIDFIQTHLFSQYILRSESTKWAIDLASYVLTVFLMHASLVRTTSEACKLQIISDMTSLEASLSKFLSRVSSRSGSLPISLRDCDTPFHALRNYRTLIVQPWSAWEHPEKTSKSWAMPTLALVQALLSRSDTLPLPNELKNMTKVSYVNWFVSTSQGESKSFYDHVQVSVLREVQEWLSHYTMGTESVNDREAIKCLKIWFRYFSNT